VAKTGSRPLGLEEALELAGPGVHPGVHQGVGGGTPVRRTRTVTAIRSWGQRGAYNLFHATQQSRSCSTSTR